MEHAGWKDKKHGGQDTPGEEKRRILFHQRNGWDGVGSGRMHLQALLGITAGSFPPFFTLHFTKDYQGGWAMEFGIRQKFLTLTFPRFESFALASRRH